MLVQAFDSLDKDSNRTLLKAIKPTALYDSALTIMMRLVFLFSAEERGLLHLGKPLYDDNYAVSTLQEQLQEVADQHGEEVLERRADAWARLLATFRAVHGGIKHQDLLMQAYGGSLFDPDRYPFLEGRPKDSTWRNTPAESLAVNNRVVLHLLNSLQRLRTKIGAGGTTETRRVSFRALGVEQIGHVYEGLLDHTAFRATEPVLGIRGTRNKEPEIPLAKLEALLADGEEKLIDFLKDETGRSVSALRRELNGGTLIDEHKLIIVSNQDEVLIARLRPFVSLIRDDSFGRPWIVLPGGCYVTAGTTRRSTGTHYTPPSLTEPIVQYTLEPLVYRGPAEGLPRDQWKLKSPKEILALKVCDMAMGSGAFLVQACRYLAERLVEAWEDEEKLHPGQVLITPDGKFSKGSPSERLVPTEPSERIAIARRVVTDRCLYGVDINPMAVEMAKLSMWLITVDANRPFTFLDHAFKCGDSLLGVTSLEQLENFSIRPGGGKQQAFATLDLWQYIDEAKKKREALEAMLSETPEQIFAKTALYSEAEEILAKLNAAADVLVAVELKGLKGRAYEAERETSANQMMLYWAKGLEALQDYAKQRLGVRRCIHWALIYPEIIERGGMDAFLGNPPFMWGMRISSAFGADYLAYLQGQALRTLGAADYCSHFFLRAAHLVNQDGCFGFIATDTISKGDTREVGLDQIVVNGVIMRAVESISWPGNANVKVALIHYCKGNWKGVRVLNGEEVSTISTNLESTISFNPKRLSSNTNTVFIGHYPMSLGFIVSHDEANRLLTNQNNRKVLYPYLIGDDVNTTPDQSASRLIINFGEMTETEALEFRECFNIVKERVKPERDLSKQASTRDKWWLYARTRPAMMKAIGSSQSVFVQPFVSKYIAPVKVTSFQVFAAPMVVIAKAGDDLFPILQSSIYDRFVRTIATNLGGTLRYAPTDCFETFPFPTSDIAALSSIGAKYHEIRRRIMLAREEGLTKIYNRFHSPEENSQDIDELRSLHVEMDNAVATTYGWQDVVLSHGFHQTKQGIRYTISEDARREVLDRLLALNHQRYAEEVAASLHDKKPRKAADKGTKRSREKESKLKDSPQLSLFYSESDT